MNSFRLLNGTVYSVKQHAPALPLWVGAIGLLALSVLLWAVCYSLLKSGWRIKN